MNEIEILLNSLKSDNDETRRQTIDIIGEMRIGEAVPALIEMINTDNWRIRKSIVEAFKKINDINCMPALSQVVFDEHVEVHSTAIDTIVNFGIKAIPYIVKHLNDKDDDIRILVSNIIGFIKSPSAAKELIKRLKLEKEFNVKYAIIEALGAIQSSDPVPLFLSMLAEEDDFIKIAIIEALGKIASLKASHSLIALLENEMFRGICIEALGNIGADIAVSPIIEYFGQDSETDEKIVKAINKIYFKDNANAGMESSKGIVIGVCRQFFRKNEYYEKLIDLLKNSDTELITGVLNILEWIDNAKMQKELIILFEQDEFTDRVKNLFLKLGKNIIDILITELHTNISYKIKRCIIEMLGIIGEIEEEDMLIKFLGDPAWNGYSDTIITSLGWMRSEKFLTISERFMKSENEIERVASIGALSIIGGNNTVDFCKKNIRSENLLLKLSCIQVLGYIGDSENISVLSEIDRFESKEIKIAFIDAISFIRDKRGVRYILQFLTETDNDVKEHIVVALTRINDKSVTPILLGMLNENNLWIKYFALRALGNLGGAEDAAEIQKLLSENESGIVIIAALNALAKIGNIIDKDILLGLLQNSDIDVKVEVINYAVSVGFKGAIEKFIEMSEESDWRIKTACIEAICKLGTEENSELIIDIYNRNNDNDIIVKKVCENIGVFKTQNVFDFLFNISDDERISNICFQALIEFPLDFLKDKLLEFKKMNESKKILLISIIEKINNEMFDDFLIQALNKTESAVKYKIIVSMGKLKRKKFSQALYPIAYPDKNITAAAKKVFNLLAKI